MGNKKYGSELEVYRQHLMSERETDIQTEIERESGGKNDKKK